MLSVLWDCKIIIEAHNIIVVHSLKAIIAIAYVQVLCTPRTTQPLLYYHSYPVLYMMMLMPMELCVVQQYKALMMILQSHKTLSMKVSHVLLRNPRSRLLCFFSNPFTCLCSFLPVCVNCVTRTCIIYVCFQMRKRSAVKIQLLTIGRASYAHAQYYITQPP